MWIATTPSGQFAGLFNPTRGRDNLGYQLRVAGLLREGQSLVGQGFSRRVVDASGRATLYVVQLPRSMGPRLLPQDLVVTLASGIDTVDTRGEGESEAEPEQLEARA